MNRIRNFMMCALVCAVTAGFAENGDDVVFSSALDYEMVMVQDVTQEQLNRMVEEGNRSLVVAFPAQTQIPFRFFFTGNLLHFVGKEKDLGYVEIAQDFYLCSQEGELLLSSDLVSWVPFLQFATGAMSIELIQEEEKPVLTFGVDLDKRLSPDVCD